MKKEKSLVTSRVLFVSILDKIYLAILAIIFTGSTYSNFFTSSSKNYYFWEKLSNELFIIVGLVISYFLINWLYKCAIKTMICVTEKEVYSEIYFPFVKIEKSIPLSKITKVSIANYFWIFRAVIIHQYNKLPLIFFTWNNKEFKNKVRELIVNDNDIIVNEFKNKNLITRKNIKFVGISLVVIIVVMLIVSLVLFLINPIRKISGTYTYQSAKIILNKDGNCDISSMDDYKTCVWSYNESLKTIDIEYTYDYYSSFLDKVTTYHATLQFDYDLKNQTLIYEGKNFTK